MARHGKKVNTRFFPFARFVRYGGVPIFTIPPLPPISLLKENTTIHVLRALEEGFKSIDTANQPAHYDEVGTTV